MRKKVGNDVCCRRESIKKSIFSRALMIQQLLLSRCQVGVNAGNGIRSIWHMEIEFVGKCTRLVVEHFGQITKTKVAHESYLLTMTTS